MIDTEGKPVAEQMWHSVQNVMTYAKNLIEIEPLLKTLGVLEVEIFPFCRRFESLVDLKDEYVKYQAKTLVYNGRRGSATADAEEDTEGDVPDASPKEIVLERVKTFASVMLKTDEGCGRQWRREASSAFRRRTRSCSNGSRRAHDQVQGCVVFDKSGLAEERPERKHVP